MRKKRLLKIQFDDQGHLILPEEILRQYGLVPGSSSSLELNERELILSGSNNRLARVYVEPTNACNLDCRTCMRNVWDEPPGRMSMQTFERILAGIRLFSPTPTVFFGGFGEPLAHPDVPDMIAKARQIGAEVELITNGVMLDRTVARFLVDVGLSRLWVSIDGATPESYADVRLGAALPQVIENLTYLQRLRGLYEPCPPKLGIAFVAMRRNINDLPEVIRLGRRLGADQFSVSNVLPHTAELRGQMMYARSIYESELQPSQWSPEVSLPRMDLEQATIERLAEVLRGHNSLRVARQPLAWGTNSCPFVEKSSTSIRWDGAVSPCLPLMHTHVSFLGEHLRTSHAHTIGNIHDQDLNSLWNDASYVRMRERLQDFDFSPCTFCNSCEMSEANLEDCFGNIAPTCGGCLWAQGFIQCP